MKNTVLIAIISLFLFASCEFKTKDRLEKEAFEIQQMAFDKIIKSYDDIKFYRFIDAHQENEMKILFSEVDSTFKKEKLYQKIEGTKVMIEHIKLLKRVSDTLYHFTGKKKILSEKMINLLKEIKKDIDTIKVDKYFTTIKGKDAKRINKFIESFEPVFVSKRIDDFDKFSVELVFLYVNYWKTSLSKLRRKVLMSYFKINEKIDNLPKEIFHDDKLREILNEPFSNSDILISMYKIKMKDDFMQGGKEFNIELKNLELGLDKLLLLNKERFSDLRTRKRLLGEIDEIKVLIGESKN